MPIDPVVIKRLAFIKAVYSVGISKSHASEPLCGMSLLMFHDAVELFLQLASEHLNAKPAGPNPGFNDYWEPLSKKTSQELLQQVSMRRMNKSRIALKHHGTLPSKLDIEAFRTSATSFFDDNTPIVFNLPFDQISLIEFVSSQVAREQLRKAEEGNLKGAISSTAISFNEIMVNYESKSQGTHYRSPFFFGSDFAFPTRFSRTDSVIPDSTPYLAELEQTIDKMQNSLKLLQEAVKVLAMGVDYRKYSRFRQVTPNVVMRASGNHQTRWRPNQQGKEITKSDYTFCMEFVIQTALALRELDYLEE